MGRAPPCGDDGRRLPRGFPALLRLVSQESEYQPVVRALRDGLWRGEVADQAPMELRVISVDDPSVGIEIDGARRSARFLARDGVVCLHHEGRNHMFRDLTLCPKASAQAVGGDGRVRAAMNGRVVAVEVRLGDRVDVGQTPIKLEAMTMEQAHTSPMAGVVTAGHAAPGQQVAPPMGPGSRSTRIEGTPVTPSGV